MTQQRFSDSEREGLKRVQDRLNAFMAELGREPNWRYFEHKPTGMRFFWTTEPYDAGGDSDGRFGGKYVSGVYVPIGRGARSGNASTLKLANDSLSSARLRKDAKARALRMLRARKAGVTRPWL